MSLFNLTTACGVLRYSETVEHNLMGAWFEHQRCKSPTGLRRDALSRNFMPCGHLQISLHYKWLHIGKAKDYDRTIAQSCYFLCTMFLLVTLTYKAVRHVWYLRMIPKVMAINSAISSHVQLISAISSNFIRKCFTLILKQPNGKYILIKIIFEIQAVEQLSKIHQL